MKKKVIIFSCNGGGGHISAAKAIETYLQDDYNITIIDAVGKLFAPLDPLYWFSFKKYTGQDIYNYLLTNNKKHFFSILYNVGMFFVMLNQSLMRSILRKYLKKEQPDLLISVIPLVNGFIAEVATEMNVPFILVPTDFDLSTFVKSLKPPFNSQFRLALSFDYPVVKQTFINAEIPEDLIKITGFPIRTSFFEEKNQIMLKKKYGIDENKLVAMVVMGAAGSCTVINYLNEIRTIESPLHIVLCIGRNNALREILQKISLPHHIGITIIDASVDISDIMAIADICITKPGSVTFAEALYMNIPVLLDCISTVLPWEKLNLSLVKQYQLGELILSEKDIVPILNIYVSSFENRFTVKQNINNIKKKQCCNELVNLVHELLQDELPQVSFKPTSEIPKLYKQNRTMYDETIR